MQRLLSIEEFQASLGEEVLCSDFFAIEQNRIDLFAEATSDHQYIHVDVEKAKDSPFGGTIAHGFLTLSMLAKLAMEDMPQPKGCKMAMNYGFEKIRFLNPVRSGARIRARVTLKGIEDKGNNRYLGNFDVTVEIEGEKAPAVVCEWLIMYFA